MSSDDPRAAIPAATLILFRQGGGALEEHLMIERAAGMAFAAGALVFPGGRIESDDSGAAMEANLTGGANTEIEERAARVAAVRETLEETGIAIALDPTPSQETVRAWRSALKANAPFSALLAESATRLDLDALVPFARWCPNLGNHRRFDTRFFIAQARSDEDIALDADEAAQYHWSTAAAAIEGARGGKHKIIFPTMRNLERLAAFPSFEQARTHAEAQPPQTISPEIREAEGEKWLCIPADAGYPVTRVALAEVPELAPFL